MGKIKINYIPKLHCICGTNEKAELWQLLWGLTFEKMFPMFCGMFFLRELTCLVRCGKGNNSFMFSIDKHFAHEVSTKKTEEGRLFSAYLLGV